MGLPKYREVNQLLIVESPVSAGEREGKGQLKVCERRRGKKLRE